MHQDLARRIEAGCVVVTPNRRLAAHVRHGYDSARLAAGRRAWPTADCLPFNAFVERIWDEIQRVDAGRIVLSPQQESALWERVIAESPQGAGLLNPAAAARAAREAWELQHACRIDVSGYRAMLDDDGRAYADWAARYGKICRVQGWIDGARLADAVIEALEAGRPLAARPLLAYAFDEPGPQGRALLYALAAHGWDVAELAPLPAASSATQTAYPDSESELTAVALQVHAALTADAAARIGVIVPDLGKRRADVIRIFDDVLEPARVVSGPRERARPYNVSLGLPLTDYALVHTALQALMLAGNEIPLEAAGSLLRSPFIAGAEQELARRALVDAALRKRGQPMVSLGALRGAARGRNASDPATSPLLAKRLEDWAPLAREAGRRKQAPSQWSATFMQLLSRLGWPGERTLDSGEYQTFRKWRDMVSGLSALDLVSPRLGYGEAISALRRIAGDAVFQPESPEVPVQVLGVLEANGLQFDRLFVTGLTDEAWPEPPRPNPFLPIALQRATGVPHASAEWNLAFARRVARRWLGAAATVRLSYPQRDGDRDLSASRLLRGISQAPPVARDRPLLREAIHRSRVIERLADFAAPALPAGVEVRGGAAFFGNQAACPFKGFAVHRLGAEALEAARVGLDARERGGLMHMAVFSLWREIGSHARLAAASEAELRSAVERSVAAASESIRRRRPDVMSAAFAALEHERAGKLLLRLLALEKERAPFEVLAREDARQVSVAGVRVSMRLDRVDRLADGAHVVLDYKTSRRVDAADWLGERPDEPQVPLYAVSGVGPVAALAFVQLHARQVGFEGLARTPGVLPGVAALAESKAAKHHAAWDAMLESWRDVLESLAREYLAGTAMVAPKDYPRTCERCDLGTLCRVKEFMDRGPVASTEYSDE